MNDRLRIIALVFLLTCCGCKLDLGSSPQQKVLDDAFSAIKSGKWEDYAEHVVTVSDYDMKANKIGAFQQSQSFSGAVMKPNEVKAHKALFLRAVKGGDDIINFKNSEFVSAGTLVEKSVTQSIVGAPIPYEVYSLKIHEGGRELDTKNLNPLFRLAEINGEYKILGLEFIESDLEEEEETE